MIWSQDTIDGAVFSADRAATEAVVTTASAPTNAKCLSATHRPDDTRLESVGSTAGAARLPLGRLPLIGPFDVAERFEKLLR